MGLKPRTGGDDFANTVMALTSEFPDVAAFIAGHTHQAIPSRLTNRVLFTQADHFGIHVGRVDLLFDRNSKKLLRREAICELMDNRFDPDHVVLSRAGSQLAQSEASLAQPIGELTETLHARGRRGHPSEIEKLIGAAITETLAERSIMVDAVMHGVFDENAKLAAGLTTINDIWNIIPYENLIVTATLSPDEIKGMMEEVYASHEPRSLLGIAVRVEGRGLDRRITSMSFPDGRALERDKRYLIAVNSFDARSGGHHFMKLRALLDKAGGELRSAPRANTRRGDRLFPAAQSCAKDCRDNAAGDRGVISPVRPCKKNRFRLPMSPCDFGSFALLVCC